MDMTIDQIVARFEEFLDHDFHGPKVLDWEDLGMKDGFRVVSFTFHRGKPEYVTVASYGFRREDWDNRINVYFL
jgi:hypothetical protein